MQKGKRMKYYSRTLQTVLTDSDNLFLVNVKLIQSLETGCDACGDE